MASEHNISIDYKLFFVILGLVVFGMVMISSVSVYPSYTITSMQVRMGVLHEPHNHFYLVRNIIHVVIGLVACVVFAKIPYQFLEKYAKFFFICTLILLVLVLMVGETYNGARGWLNIPLLPFLVQPTEFLKLSIILYFSSFLKKKQKHISDFEQGFLPYMFLLGSVMLLVALQPDF